MKEKRFTSPQKCGHCGNVAPMEVGATYAQTQTHEYENGSEWEHGKVFDLIICPACQGVILRSYFWHEGVESEEEIRPETLYPSEIRLPPGLPPSVQRAFVSALKVRSVDSNAFGVLIGRVLEEVHSERKANGKFLANKLKDLAERREIPTQLVGVADGLRELRNFGGTRRARRTYCGRGSNRRGSLSSVARLLIRCAILNATRLGSPSRVACKIECRF
jgi:Domain of unknown function (DUF4145)